MAGNKKKTTETKNGRPEIYSDELALEVCNRIADGNSLRKVCLDEEMPSKTTVFRWIRDHKEFRDQYAHACEERSEAMSEEILDISDDGTNDWMEVEGRGGNTYTVLNNEAMQRSRLRIETRKWLMSKMKPKKYGDKLDVTSDGKPLPTPIYGGKSSESSGPSGE